MPQNKKAVDVVIIPPEDFQEKCIELSQKSHSQGHSPYVLDEKNILPHLSLFMGVMDEDNLDEVIATLKKISDDIDFPVKIDLPSFSSSSFQVSKTESLMKLHEKVVKNIEPLVEHDVNSNYYLNNDPGEPDALDWVKNFEKKYSFDNFDPHITIRQVDDPNIDLPYSFKVDNLALCHLGAFNTCRKIIWSNN